MNNEILAQALSESGYSAELQSAVSAGAEDIFGALTKNDILNEYRILEALAKKMCLRMLARRLPDAATDAVKLIPRTILERYCMLPLSVSNGVMSLAVCDPTNVFAVEDIRQIAGMPVELCLCESRYIRQGIAYYCSDIEAKNVSVSWVSGGEDDSPAVRVVDALIARGYSANASDIHIEPFGEHTSVRMRIDGMITEYEPLPGELHQSVIARIKILSNLDIAERRLPQDGNMTTDIGDISVNIRVSLVPTVYGEKAVLRFLDRSELIDNAEQFGMDAVSYAKMSEILSVPNGLVYLTGPTGSGKTTTMYLILEQLAKKSVNICTIEDPVERRLAKVNQTAVNSAAGITFGTGLRALLRQDPDVIMIGETRDCETAEISVRAAITGHLVLSTLHTIDAASALTRLVDMGVARYLAADSLAGITAQRLLRKVCPECGAYVEPTLSERRIVGQACRYIRRGRGCNVCNYSGYKGRVAIHEILRIDSSIRQMINDGATAAEIREYAAANQGMKPLAASAAELAASGVTTPEEVMRTVYFNV
ncbi:MAG: GspE/PulE family protein [Oscillospiraceae bacterium]